MSKVWDEVSASSPRWIDDMLDFCFRFDDEVQTLENGTEIAAQYDISGPHEWAKLTMREIFTISDKFPEGWQRG